jgi:hypothetical protein
MKYVKDETEDVRRVLTTVINSAEAGREILEKDYGQVWNTEELKRDFDVQGFMAPFVSVRRKADGVRGVLAFQHHPRFYFDFMPEGK